MENRKKKFVTVSVVFVCVIGLLLGYSVHKNVEEKILNNDSSSLKQSKNVVNRDGENKNINTSDINEKNQIEDGNYNDSKTSNERINSVKSNDHVEKQDGNEQGPLVGNEDMTVNEHEKETTSNNVKIDMETIKVVNEYRGDACAQALDIYYEDEYYQYYFSCKISNYVFVYVGGKKYTISYALNNRIVTIKDIENSGFKVLKKAKNTVSE